EPEETADMASDVTTLPQSAYQDPSRPLEARVEDLLARLTLEEKVALMAGASPFRLEGVARLGVPSLGMTDGPTGVRSNTGQMATVFPVAVALAATFNPDLTREVAGAIAREAIALGEQVVLAPTINIVRTPLWGRNFETFSEDPYLTAELAIGYVEGLQGEGIGASLKHYAANNQEERRMDIDVEVDERTLREIYLSAFEATVKAANPWTAMASYNKLRGSYASENAYLLQDILKGEWAYDGVVVSDWGAVHSTVPAASNGLDLEMPGPPIYLGAKLLAAVKAGQVPEARIDEAARRLIRLILRAGLLDGVKRDGELRTDRHRHIARRAAEEAIVLLKNDGGLLPLDADAIKTLAVIGPNANFTRLQGDGSSRVSTDRWPTPLESLGARLPKAKLIYAQGGDAEPTPPQAQARMFSPTEAREAPGLTAEYFTSADFSGAPVRTNHERRLLRWISMHGASSNASRYAALRWSGFFWPEIDGAYEVSVRGDGAAKVVVGDQTLIDFSDDGREDVVDLMGGAALRRTGAVELKAGRGYRFSLEYVWADGRPGAGAETLSLGLRQPPGEIESAVAAARQADTVVLVVGSSSRTESEGYDRKDIDLPGEQDVLIEQIALANPRTVVVVNAGAAMAMPWIDKVAAVVQVWLPGEEGPDALTSILLGEISPSGRLPVTFPRRLEDNPAYGFYPGGDSVTYGEGLGVGYRHYDLKGIEPLFAFGHGLTYGEFTYADLAAPASAKAGAPVEVTLRLTNTGKRTAAETVQIYVAPVNPSKPAPPKALKAFAKVELKPGETRTVAFSLEGRAFAHYDEVLGRWTVEAGAYDILAAASAVDARLTARLEITG
ncbi:MAG TPA: glycoside hydrolase family 3 protein, partial [Caulobacteraceae bacterium]|nr:glycoside hydrolase family 3 protein [Caulobacteraceae bacterium]